MENNEDVLGRGAFTIVYKGVYDGKPCAVKLVDDKDNSKRYVRREVDIYKALAGCKHVVKMLDYRIKSATNTKGGGFIKYERLERNLLQIIDELNKDDITRIAAQLDEALREIHSRGVIHCDIKPENIMFDVNNDLKLIDFGNAMFAEKLQTTKQPIGTLPYRPPEYIIGAPMDNRVDTWAAGCVLMEMLTGTQLFNPRRDNDVYVHSYLLGEMINVLGEMPDEFIKSGKYADRYFDVGSDKCIYRYRYLLAKPSSLRKVLRSNGYSRNEATYWAERVAGYFIR